MAVVEGSLEDMVKSTIPDRFLFFRHSWKGLRKLGGLPQQYTGKGKLNLVLRASSIRCLW